jgi:hypothetical protein
MKIKALIIYYGVVIHLHQSQTQIILILMFKIAVVEIYQTNLVVVPLLVYRVLMYKRVVVLLLLI